MSPTIVAKKKMDLKKNNQFDGADKPIYDQQYLRQPERKSYSPQRHLYTIRSAWRPQSGAVNTIAFNQMKPAPKLQKCLTYRKSQSILEKNPRGQD